MNLAFDNCVSELKISFCTGPSSLTEETLSLPLSLYLYYSTSAMNNKRKRTPANPNPRNSMQAFHFLRSLSLINLTTATFHKRYRAIRRAAYASMARSTNPNRAWRHAVLSHLRRKARPVRDRVRARGRKSHHDDALRQILPGGEAMDSSRLLEETIDYVQLLSAQVKLMQEIVDSVKGDGVEKGRKKEGN